MPDSDHRDWNTVRYHIMQVLDEVRQDLKSAGAKMQEMETRLAVMETKASIMGASWGSVASLIVAVATYFITKGLR